MVKQTTVSFLIITDTKTGKRAIQPLVGVSDAGQFKTEEEKEESTASDISYLFDQILSGELSKQSLI
jgi:hypothetical protein